MDSLFDRNELVNRQNSRKEIESYNVVALER